MSDKSKDYDRARRYSERYWRGAEKYYIPHCAQSSYFAGLRRGRMLEARAQQRPPEDDR